MLVMAHFYVLLLCRRYMNRRKPSCESASKLAKTAEKPTIRQFYPDFRFTGTNIDFFS